MSAELPYPDRFISRLITAIADGSDLDWNHAEASATAQSRELVLQLHDLARVAAALRVGADVADVADAEELAVPGRWGPLEIEERIATGRFGDVYRARDPRLDCEVALKLLRPGDSGRAVSDTVASEVIHEGRLLAKVSHPNVARVFGAERHGGRVGVWMELIRGRDLESLLAEQGRLGADEAARIGQDLCRALAAVHGAGVLHRDLKATNVMREDGGRIVLMDLGTGRELSRPETWDATGTPLYMAPELFCGRPATVQSDIYSLGVLLFRLVTGQCPVTGRSYAAIGAAHAAGKRTLLADLRPDLPEPFVRAVERAIEPEPGRRYESAGAFEGGLAAATGTFVPHPSRARSSRRRWSIRGLAGGAALAAVLLLLWFFWSGAAYDVQATLYRVRGAATEPLLAGATIAPGDRLLLELGGSRELYVYVISRDDHGESYLLFPMRRSELGNPLAAGRPHRLPGTRDGVQLVWTVTSEGGREHLVIVASPERLSVLESDIHGLDRPRESARDSGDGKAAAHDLAVASGDHRVDDGALTRFRGIGGSTKHPLPATRTELDAFFTGIQHLATRVETVRGVWVRQIDLEYERP